MKVCVKCDVPKELSEFSNDGKASWCVECVRERSKQNYLDNREERLKKHKIRDKERTDEFIKFKQTLSCEKCDENRWYVLDFHHKDPSKKDFNVSNMKKSKNIILLKKEIEKCIILCKNCHYEFHHLEREEGITIRQYLK